MDSSDWKALEVLLKTLNHLEEDGGSIDLSPTQAYLVGSCIAVVMAMRFMLPREDR